MDGRTLQSTAQKRAETLPEAGLVHPFGPEYEVFKVQGKVFMLMTEVHGRPVVVLKAEPEDAEALREGHSDITSGYHMNKRHWITLAPGDSINETLVEELVADSYRLVVNNLPRSRRPFDPETVGTHSWDSTVVNTGERLQQVARSTVQALPGVDRGRPFVDKLDVYKVAGKVFLIVTDDPDELIITVKVEPDRGRYLRNRYSSVVPGRYLDKTHWISVGAAGGVTAQLVEDLVDHSYELVLGSVPRARRPGKVGEPDFGGVGSRK